MELFKYNISFKTLRKIKKKIPIDVSLYGPTMVYINGEDKNGFICIHSKGRPWYCFELNTQEWKIIPKWAATEYGNIIGYDSINQTLYYQVHEGGWYKVDF